MSGGSLPKVPAAPPPHLTTDWNRHIRDFRGPLWRAYATGGAHPQAWNSLRHFGPAPGMRFDPHPLPQGHHDHVGVMYTATLPTTSLAEVFQSSRVIERSLDARAMVSWRPTRTLKLLVLTTNWPVLNGSAAAMMMDAKHNTQPWARAIHEHLRNDIDGLYHLSSLTSQPLVTLFSGAVSNPSFPARPDFNVLLAARAADIIIDQATRDLGYGSVP
ncbi:RES family NAD+ phosphorylase [Micrococcales bacterium 31B]|nr:RES family NAD+ phosphorylase [Micrococcales bacterium 31B]